MFSIPSIFKTLPQTRSPLKLGAAAQQGFGPSIKMVSWNIYKGQRRGWVLDLEHLSAANELVLLQEAVLFGGLAQPFHLTTGMEWIMAETLEHAGRSVTTGPKTGSRVSAVDSYVLRTRDAEPLLGTPKTLLATTYPFGNNRLLVLNVHAINLVNSSKYERQISQITALVGSHAGPCLVAGDFNTWNNRRWRVLIESMETVGFRRVPAQFAHWRHFRRVLDHVFYKDLRLLNARALTHIKSSDHVPLWAEFGPAG